MNARITKQMSRWLIGLSCALLLVGISLISSVKPLAANQPSGVITASRYVITIDGYAIATFNELSGISAEVEPTEYWETSGDNIPVNKLPGKVKPPSITLKRGANGSLELWAWHEAVRRGDMAAARRSCTLTMYDSRGVPVAKYWLENAWPNKMDLAGLKAGASEALLETVTLTCEHIQRVAP